MARILVCEDEAIYREFCDAILTAAGHQVETAPDGEIGLERLGAAEFDLVVTDLLMPGRDGLEVIRGIRGIRADIPIIAITSGLPGYVTPLTRAATAFGATRILEKPLRPAELTAAVEDLLVAG